MTDTNSLKILSKNWLVAITIPAAIVTLIALFFNLAISDNSRSNLPDNTSKVQGAETSSKQVTLAQSHPQPITSDWIDTTGYTKITIDLSITKWITNYSVEYSNDKSNVTEQSVIECGNGSQCPQVTLPILGKFYRISSGIALGDITSTGILN